MDATLGLPLLVGLIAVALLFDFLNGLHDAANSIATIVSTRVLRPQYAKIAALIKRISAKYTIVMVEHNLNVVANLSDIITVLTRGKVLAEGNYNELTKDERVKEAYLGAGHA